MYDPFQLRIRHIFGRQVSNCKFNGLTFVESFSSLVVEFCRLSYQTIVMVHEGNLFKQMGLLPEEKPPFFLGFVFGPVLIGFCKVGAHVKLLPKFCPAGSADKWLDLYVMVRTYSGLLKCLCDEIPGQGKLGIQIF